MGRAYAGVLGPLAFCTVVARGLIGGSSAEATLQSACFYLFVFAIVGYVCGRLASWTVEEAVMGRFKAELIKSQKEGEPSTRIGGG